MRFLLYFALVCAMAIAKPMEEAKKQQESSISLLDTRNETALNNSYRVERNGDPLIHITSEIEDKEQKTDSNADYNTSDDTSRHSYASTTNQINPVYSSQSTSTHNIDSSYPERSVSEDYRSIYPMHPSRQSYEVGSESYGLLEPPGFSSSSYPSTLYGLGSGSYEFSGLPESYGSLQTSVIPTSYSNSIPYHGGISVAQQIIHKPIITELQEVIHKPVITEVQEIVKKPVVSEVQQVIHKPLYTEHIGLGPSYQGYQKHIVQQPIYQKPTKHLVQQPVAHAGTINLADEYEHAISTTATTHCVGAPGVGSIHGYSGATLPALYGSDISIVPANALYRSTVSAPSIIPYEPIYSSATPVSANYYPFFYSSTPHASIPAVPTSYKYAATDSIDYSIPSKFSYSSLPSFGYTSEPNSGKPYDQQRPIFNTDNKELYKSNEEQITYDVFQPYKQQSNYNQQYYDNQFQPQFSEFQPQFSGFQQQWVRSSENSHKIKMDVDAIAKQIEKNPEMRKQLLKIITENMYIGDQTLSSDKPDKTIQKSPLK